MVAANMVLVIAEKGDPESGYAAIDGLVFNQLQGPCQTLPPTVGSIGRKLN
jgi:hypothetical protein